MTITFVAAGAIAANGTAITMVAPTCQAGDLLIAAIGMRNGGATITAPSGWALAGKGTTSPCGAFYTKVATAVDSGGSFAFSASTGNISGAVLAYRGAGGTDAFAAATATKAGTPVTAPTVTTTQANEFVLELFVVTSAFGGYNVSGPPPTNRVASPLTTGISVAIAVSDQAQAAAGTSTAQSAATSSSSTTSAAATLSIYPATVSYGSVVVGGVKKPVVTASVIVGGVKKPVTAMSVIVDGVKKPLA